MLHFANSTQNVELLQLKTFPRVDLLNLSSRPFYISYLGKFNPL
jgi:hypothetical protein